MAPARRLRRRTAALLVAAAALTFGSVGPVPARADTIASKQAQADQIASKIDQLNQQIEIYAEQYNAATIELGRIKAAVADAQAKVDQTKAEEAVRRSQLQDYAVQAYVNGGSADPLPVLLNSDDSNAVGQRTGYLRAAVGDRQQLIDALNATEQDLSTQIAELGAAQAKAQSVTNDLAARKSSADAAVAQQTQLLSSVKGQLAQLVQQEQARRARAAAAAAAAHASAASRSSGHSGGGTSGGTSGGGGTATPPPQSGGAAGAVALARQQIGKPYVWGASGPSAFDCSGLTYYVWKYGGGVTLPHNSASQWSATTHIPISALQPGDLVFYGHPIHHVAIYVGGGQIIHAPHAGASVSYDSLYYWDAIVGAGRVG